MPLNGIDSQNFAQDPAGPIWTALYRYIYPEIYFTTTETHFFRQQYTRPGTRLFNNWRLIEYLKEATRSARLGTRSVLGAAGKVEI